MDQFMNRSIQLAVENIYENSSRPGVMLFQTDRSVEESINRLHQKYSISSLPELRGRERRLDTKYKVDETLLRRQESRMLGMKQMPLIDDEKNPMKLWKASNANE